MPPRVLFVARWYPSYDDPGRGIFVADQAAALRAAGAEVVVASFESVVDRRAALNADAAGDRAPMASWAAAIGAHPSLARPISWGASDIPVARLPAAVPTSKAAERDPVEIARAEAVTLVAFGMSLAGRWPFDLIHAHTGLPDGFAAAQLADRLDLPLVITEHESGLSTRLATEAAKEAYRSLFGAHRRVVAVSATLARQLTDLLGPSTPSIEIVPNAIDIAAFRSAGPDERDADEILWVGARQASKGTDELLGAFSLLHAERPTLRLRLIGRASSSPEEARLQALARTLGIDDAVTFEPSGDRVVVAAAMSRAAVFVHPSPRETFGVVAVEALASGLPVAAAPSGGVEEILGADGKYGEIATSTGAADLATAVARVLDRRRDFDPAALRAHAEARYAAAVVAARILDVYRSVTDVALKAGTGPADLSSAPLGPRPLVVALRRDTALKRLGTLPPSLAASLSVVTSAVGRIGAVVGPGMAAGSAGRADSADIADFLEVDADGSFRAAVRRLGGPVVARSMPGRAAAAARHPIWAFQVWRLAGRRAELRLAAQRDAIRTAVDGISQPGQRIEVLPLDVDDIAIIQPLLSDRICLYPTTLRGLADRWDEAGRPVSDPAARRAAPAPAVAADADAPVYDPTAYWSALHDRNDLSAVGQSALPPEINAWLYRALAGNLRRFLGRHGIRRPVGAAAFDIGVGSGYWVRFWRSLGVQTVDGCDLIPEAVDRVRSEAEASGAAGTFVAADISLPGALPATTYPIVSCLNVLLHVVDDDRFDAALRNIAALVAPGGYLILAEPILADAEYEAPFDPRRQSRARALPRYRDPLLAAGLELVDHRGAVVLANNPIEAGSAAALRRYRKWWRFLAGRSKADPRSARWLGPLVLGLDRLAMTSGAAPSTKFALFRRPPASKDA